MKGSICQVVQRWISTPLVWPCKVRWARLVLPPLVAAIAIASSCRGAVAQTEPPRATQDVTGPFRLHLSGGLSHLGKGTGLSAGLGGGVLLGRLQVSVTAIHATWIPIDPEPGYKRLHSIMGSIICQDRNTQEIVDERHCDDTSTEIGAMGEVGLSLGSGSRPVVFGGGYRVGAEGGSFISVGWGPGFTDPGASWKIVGRFGARFIEGAASISFWPRRNNDRKT